MRETIAFTKELLFTPSKAIERFKTPEAALRESFYIYLAHFALIVLFYTYKPENFPPLDEAARWATAWGQYEEPHGILFWTKVQAWAPLLTLIEVVFLGWFSSFLRPSGGLLRGPARLLVGCVFGLLPMIPLLLYKYDVISKIVFASSWLAILAAMLPGLKRRGLNSWKTLASLSMALNIVNMVLLVPFTLSVLLRSVPLYHGLEIVMLIWTLGLGTYLLRRIEDISSARACLALMLAVVFCPAFFVFSAYLLGLLPREILKAMMTL